MATKKVSAKDFVEAMNATAEKLSKVRSAIREREDDFKRMTDNLYADEKSLKEELLGALKTIGLSSVKTAEGDSYFISKTHDFEVTNELELDKYAREQRCVRIDRTALRQRFNKALKEGALPAFVKASERETISIKSAKKEAVAEDTG